VVHGRLRRRLSVGQIPARNTHSGQQRSRKRQAAVPGHLPGPGRFLRVRLAHDAPFQTSRLGMRITACRWSITVGKGSRTLLGSQRGPERGSACRDMAGNVQGGERQIGARDSDLAASPLRVFGTMLRHYRTRAGMSQEQLAARVYCSADLIAKIRRASGPRPRS
jgi:hypothetical protein